MKVFREGFGWLLGIHLINLHVVKNGFLKIFFLALSAMVFLGWGSAGHKIINRKTVLFFPPQMNAFQNWRDSLAAHGSDADYRKSSDPTEEFRHYIDIDLYPEFIANHRIPQTLDSLIALHGITFVTENGLLPFAIISYTDSLKNYFLQHNWRQAMLRASDVGHYVADAHQPLHITRWYNGWSSFSNGIHSRYETGLINRDSAYIQYSGDTIFYINNINEFSFNIIYNNYKYVDSVYRCDSIAHVIAGNTSSALYYQEFWNRAGNFTIQLFRNASKALASLIYTAWVNAGSPLPTGIQPLAGEVKDFHLFQNYPNPFNPETKIKFVLKEEGRWKMQEVKLIIYNIQGKEIETLVNGALQPGTYEVTFKGNNIPSGIYYYKLSTGNYSETRKMILVK